MPKSTEELYQELLEQGRQQQQQAQDYLNAYDNRGQFSYDAANDPLYQSLKNQYVHQGRRAMEDTMGQAAGLTGGYGSSYSQSVGNQAYNEYLTQLNAQIPGLAQQARANWDAEGNRLLDRYNLALNAANTAYGQARDALGDLRYDQEYNDNRAYQQWQMDRADQSDARSYAEMMIKMGLMPSSDVLAAAGWSEADVQRMVDYYKSLQNASGGSGGRYYGGTPTPEPEATSTSGPQLANIIIKGDERQNILEYAMTHNKADFDAWYAENYKDYANYDDVLNWVMRQILASGEKGKGGTGGGGTNRMVTK